MRTSVGTVSFYLLLVISLSGFLLFDAGTCLSQIGEMAGQYCASERLVLPIIIDLDAQQEAALIKILLLCTISIVVLRIWPRILALVINHLHIRLLCRLGPYQKRCLLILPSYQ